MTERTINVTSAPDRRRAREDALTIKTLEARIALLEAELERVSGDLDVITKGIANGDPVSLSYPDGEVIAITKARPRRSGDAET